MAVEGNYLVSVWSSVDRIALFHALAFNDLKFKCQLLFEPKNSVDPKAMPISILEELDDNIFGHLLDFRLYSNPEEKFKVFGYIAKKNKQELFDNLHEAISSDFNKFSEEYNCWLVVKDNELMLEVVKKPTQTELKKIDGKYCVNIYKTINKNFIEYMYDCYAGPQIIVHPIYDDRLALVYSIPEHLKKYIGKGVETEFGTIIGEINDKNLFNAVASSGPDEFSDKYYLHVSEKIISRSTIHVFIGERNLEFIDD